MQDAFSRMELLVGNTGVKKLSMAKIAVFGLAEPERRQQRHSHAAVWEV